MADYAGAVAAMRARFVANFTAVPIAFQNETPQDGSGNPIQPWPPADAVTGKSLPWAYFEVIATASRLRGAGQPGNHMWLTTGWVKIHVVTPEGYGYAESLRLADLAGEVFRAQTFYQDGAGAKVVCLAPQTDGGDSASDDGNWFRVTASIPFEFYFFK